MAESNVMSGAMSGVMSAATGSASGSTGLLRFNLGYWQVYDDEFLSYSQTGNFSDASRDGADIVAEGPSALYPNARLRKRRLIGAEWENAIIFLTVSGQSTAMGATTGATEEGSDSAAPFYTILPPLPGKLKGPTGGTIPNQAGPGSPANAAVIDPATYANLVDLCEGINVGRTGADVERETPGMTMATVLADAVPDSSIVVLVNTGAGSSSFNDTVGKTNSITGYTWSEPSGPGSGQIVFNIFATHYVQAGASWTVSGITPSAANGTYTVTARTGTTITVAKATDPTAWVSGGTFDDPSICWQNATTIIDYVIANLAGGRTPKFAGHLHMGNEASSTAGTEAVFAISAAFLRGYVNARGLRIEGSAVSRPLVWPGVNSPRGSWNDDENRVGEASWHGMGQLYIIENDIDANLVTTPLYFADSGYGSPVGSPHYDQKGYMRIGAKEGHLLLDKLLGEEIDPPCIVDDTLERVANSATITGTLSGTFVKDTTEVSDPGNSGIQLFTADGDTYQATLTEHDIDTVTVGSTISVVADAVPDPRRNWIAAGFKNATETKSWCGLAVTGASWAANVATVTVDGTHGIAEGDTIQFTGINPSGYNVSGATLLAGTTGNTLVFALTPDPGAYVSGGNVVRNAIHCVGNKYGNRTTLRLSQVRHYSPLDGAPLPDYMVQHKRQVKVYPSVPGLIDQINELDTYISGGMTFPAVYDFADTDCYPGTGQLVTNLGTGSDLNYYLGNSSGVDAFDMVFVGTADSKDRNTYLEAPAASTGRFLAVGSPTLMANSHKTGGISFGVVAGKYVTSANPQYIWSTAAHSGGTVGAGCCLRIAANGVPQLRVANASNATVWSLSGTALANGDRFVIAWGWYEGGKSFIWVNGTLTEDNSTTFTSPSAAAAQSVLQLGVAPVANTRLVTGFQLNELSMSDTSAVNLTFGDLEPQVNGVYRRHIEDAY